MSSWWAINQGRPWQPGDRAGVELAATARKTGTGDGWTSF